MRHPAWPAWFARPVVFLLLVAATAFCRAGTPSPAAIERFTAYTQAFEAKLNQQERSASTFIPEVADPAIAARLRKGELIIEDRMPANALASGALLHDWRGDLYVPGVTATDCERLFQNYPAYPQIYAPEILAAAVLGHQGDLYQVKLRLRQKHVLTVVYDTYYDVTFGRLDAQHGSSISRSTRIAEISAPGTPQEHPMSAAEEHGFLWRMNVYWRWEQRDGGVYLQMETVTLTRAIPTGLGWLIGSYVQKVPRESLEFTLSATRKALRH